MAKRNAEAGGRKRTVARRSALAALAMAWLHGWAQRQDQRPTWHDAAVVAGLATAWLLERKQEDKKEEEDKKEGGI